MAADMGSPRPSRYVSGCSLRIVLGVEFARPRTREGQERLEPMESVRGCTGSWNKPRQTVMAGCLTSPGSLDTDGHGSEVWLEDKAHRAACWRVQADAAFVVTIPCDQRVDRIPLLSPAANMGTTSTFWGRVVPTPDTSRSWPRS
jgi:hypothetical protein